MKQFLHLVFLFVLMTLLGACRSGTVDSDLPVAVEQNVETATTIYLVRHAEKATSDPSNEDPDLTPTGMARAQALRGLLQGEEIHALYATKYVRTIQTLKPLAEERQLEIIRYEGHDFNGLRERLLRDHRGQTVVVAGHSNTLLPIIEALGIKRPIGDIADSEYNYVFKLIIDQENKTIVEVNQYGG
jgi:2,3-bisphosphoglycerate-dependent phosphoglycerate mutase